MSFNAIVGWLMALKTLKSQNIFGALPPETPPGIYPRLQVRFLCNRFFPYKIQSLSTKQTLV